MLIAFIMPYIFCEAESKIRHNMNDDMLTICATKTQKLTLLFLNMKNIVARNGLLILHIRLDFCQYPILWAAAMCSEENPININRLFHNSHSIFNLIISQEYYYN